MTANQDRTLFCFGLGFSALATARRLKKLGWHVSGTVRTGEKADSLRAEGIQAYCYEMGKDLELREQLEKNLTEASHILISIPPVTYDLEPQEIRQSQAKNWQDPVYSDFKQLLIGMKPRWLGYLSTTVVYGDHSGNQVHEETKIVPTGARGLIRAAVEKLWTQTGLPLHIFRLAGIYGPGRNALERLKKGRDQIIYKPGQVFSRIHVDDIATTLIASMAKPAAQPFLPEIYNVCDNEPAPPQDVIFFAAQLLGKPPPPVISFEKAKLSPMARSFYADNKRVSNEKIRHDLGVKLAYPGYREGLETLHADMCKIKQEN